jgi:hypothetical protein
LVFQLQIGAGREAHESEREKGDNERFFHKCVQ